LAAALRLALVIREDPAMPSLQAKITKRLLRVIFSGWAEGSVAEQRARQEKTRRFSWPAKGCERRPVDVNGVAAEWFVPAASAEGVVLYLHGGAYVLGSVASHGEFLTRLANTTKATILAINYRLAPEHPFPAALEDTVSAYRWLLAQGLSPSELMLAGDSAGGGLAISALIALRDDGAPLPAGAICISPWVDLALTGASVSRKARLDPILTPASLRNSARLYAAGHALTSPMISPLYAALDGLPPLMILAGTDEVLEDDAIRIAEKARQAGVAVTLEDWEGMFHVFPITPFLPESQQALERIADFVSGARRHFQAAPEAPG
jgi:acetyl esterase/lipase